MLQSVYKVIYPIALKVNRSILHRVVYIEYVQYRQKNGFFFWFLHNFIITPVQYCILQFYLSIYKSSKLKLNPGFIDFNPTRLSLSLSLSLIDTYIHICVYVLKIYGIKKRVSSFFSLRNDYLLSTYIINNMGIFKTTRNLYIYMRVLVCIIC